MRTKLLSFFAVIAMVILFMSSFAGADSWVLWSEKEYMQTNMKSNIFWKIIDAYPDYKQCLQGMNRVWQVKKKQALEDKEKYGTISEVKDVPYSMIITNFKEPKEIHSISETLYCLPGTLDPREKK